MGERIMWSEIMKAIAQEHPVNDTLILRGDLNLKTCTNSSLVHLACVIDSTDWLERLIEEGLDVNSTNDNGESPLHWAALYHPKHVAILLKHNANPMMYDTKGNLPLHFAAESGRKDIIELLLQFEYRPQLLLNYQNQTPLMVAIYHGNLDVAALLSNQTSFLTEVLRFGMKADMPDLLEWLTSITRKPLLRNFPL